MEIIEKFNKYIFKTYNIQMTNCLTIAKLGLEIFMSKFIPKNNNSGLPLIIKKDIFKFIKEGYFGGITEVYKPYGENLFYYDVNSEYPFVAKNKMPGKDCTYVEDFTGKGLNLEDLFGFFYCKVKTNNGYLGLLPLHIKGNLILPNGEFFGT
ncbi:DNA polymerase type B, organellar and viral-domain-containing protein [Mucidula mucida]|nr:DNA polymerase type B, organellar and viral-domain-containing protein [Mucidula mucida]